MNANNPEDPMLKPLAGLLMAGMLGACGAVPATPTPSPAPEVGLPRGAVAPEIHAQDGRGRPWSLSEARHGGPIALVFYRGQWCPFCMHQLQELNQAALPVAKAAHVPLVALSVDTPEEGEAMRRQYGYGFPVLSVGLETLKAYNIVNPVDWKDKPAIAHPGVFVVGSDGKLTYAFADKNYKNRAPAADVIEAIEALRR
jgi:peroxiredoxin